MIRYVAGLMFSADCNHVALIEKQKPSFMVGRLNAIGGKVEGDEWAADAMVREFHEKTGVKHYEWELFAVLNGPDFQVQFFTAFHDSVFRVATVEDEQVSVVPVADLAVLPLMDNLRVFVPLALDRSGIVKPVHFKDSVKQQDKASPIQKISPEALGFVDSMETRPTDMRRSIHRSNRGEGRNFVD